MGKNSKIEWTDHTFNPWIGCAKISPGCQHCYAETLDKRWGNSRWGPGAKREKTSEANWRKPLKWDRQAKREGRRYKVFCGSMCDVFEDNNQVIEWRRRLWDLIAQTPNLDWLLLTKRPENVSGMTPWQWYWTKIEQFTPNSVDPWPGNVWMGASIENQQTANERIPELIKIPAPIRFLSVEPLLEQVKIEPAYLRRRGMGIDWLIVGGESGHRARPMHPDWIRSIRDQCLAAGAPFFFKQWGAWYPQPENRQQLAELMYSKNVITSRGWPQMVKLGKKEAGRVLDNKIWNQFPTPPTRINRN